MFLSKVFFAYHTKTSVINTAESQYELISLCLVFLSAHTLPAFKVPGSS